MDTGWRARDVSGGKGFSAATSAPRRLVNLATAFDRGPLFLGLVLCGLLLCASLSPSVMRPARRFYLEAGGAVRETQLAWARWIAARHGVALLIEGSPPAGAPAVCLTFDDGPHLRTCTAILDALRHAGVHATFFVVGTRARQHPELLRRMVREGHEIGNHTYDHRRLVTLEPAKIGRELRSLQEVVERCAGVRPTLCRPPGGTYDARALEICRDEGLRVCLWSVNAGDWKKTKTAAQIAREVIDHVQPGAIVLLHDETPATPAALPEIIRTLRARGYRFLTASEMVPVAPRENIASRSGGASDNSGERPAALSD